jgi:hypothetical protein
MSPTHATINFGGGFMYVFDEDHGGAQWSGLTAGTVRPAAGPPAFGEHKLTLVRVAGTVEGTTLAPVEGDTARSWDLSGCRVLVNPSAVSQAILAPLDDGAAPPDPEDDLTLDLQWENWKWVLDPVAFHLEAGTLKGGVPADWRSSLESTVEMRSGLIVPLRGFDKVHFRARAHERGRPASNVTQWRGTTDDGPLVLEVSGKRNGHLRFAASHGNVALVFLHHEPPLTAGTGIRDLAMIYSLIDVDAADRITEGEISGQHAATPGKTCGSARFVAPR